ncbi:Fic family protein [Candidatus Neptunochlamydia vexilliferae]|uniref:Fido domain-containing protein n=1 Tax=Candidatus Neptunichlamydia vexilliferae TaxID=1651774 RepID=A0ABS0AWR5_9BACT|nr:Fic family protein [Candidatus Neptunochlamydia vexilliferae]MBF5058579.1 hypothetical protein [Candidatus Neptunochlamydia vexilliferae]
MGHKEDYKRQIGGILELIRRFPEGLSASEILEKSGDKWSRRSLQRKLLELQKDGMVRREGGKKTARYFATGLESGEIKEEEPSYLPISKEGKEVQSYILSPIGSRKPVGYHREFFESYIPNRTFYLSESDRKELFEIGKQPDGKKPAGTFARDIFDRLLVDLSWNSSRLEGNTYSLLETERLIAQGVEAGGKSSLETQMILNHKEAIEFLVDSVNEVKMNSITIRNLHAFLSDELLGNSEACGKVRAIPVGISGTVFHPLEIPQLIEEFLEEILLKAEEIKDPFEQAFFIMVQLPYLQPFEDVNKRVARLAANIPLIKGNLCPLSFIDVPEDLYVEGILGVYELNRIELLKDVFLWAYKRSTIRYSAIRHSVKSPDPFRLEHREEMKQLVRKLILEKMDKESAIVTIHDWAEIHLKKADRPRFTEIVERELMALHIGNIQRYKVSPKQFEAWQKSWS